MLVAFIVWLVSLVGMTLSAIKSPARFENSIMNVFDSVFEHDDEILYKEFTAEEIEAWRKEQQQAVEDIEKNGEAILKELEEQAEQHLSQLEDI
jgi:hypothetical protein